ncbi:MAG: hypothetical protein QFE16_00355 [Pseudomonadota bacterium]|nr:hypothetical protein [Pseudomonadota bacterium]
MSNRSARLERLERQLLRDRSRADLPQAVVRYVGMDGTMRDLDTIEQRQAWPSAHVRMWHRDPGEGEAGFVGRVIAGAGSLALLLEACA